MKIQYVFDLPEGDKDLYDLLKFNPSYAGDIEFKRDPIIDPKINDRAGFRGYNRVYSKYITPLRDKPLNILEIGIERGDSLVTWSKYFRNSLITGAELNYEKNLRYYERKYKRYSASFNRVKIFQVDSTKKEDWQKITGSYDIIIDDGSHDARDQLLTLQNAWPHLKMGGWYFCEDITETFTYKTGREEHSRRLETLFKYADALSVNNYVAIYKHLNLKCLASRLSRKHLNFPSYDYMLVIKKETDEIPG